MKSSTGNALEVRPVNEMDAGAIEAIDEKITGLYRPDHWEKQIAYYIARDPELAVVAEQAGDVVGFMFADLRGWEFGFEKPVAWIEVLGIHPAHQKKGVGKALAETLFRRFKEKDAERVLTLVDEDAAGIARFMQSMGLAASRMTVYGRNL